MKTTYICPAVPGEKRTSERLYTHAIIGVWNRAAEEARTIKEYEYHSSRGEKMNITLEKQLEHIAIRNAANPIQKPVVLGWSQSYKNACKAAASFSWGYTNIEVVEAVPQQK